MKQINFLSTLPPAKQRSMLVWYRTSWYLFVLLIFGISIMQIEQLMQLRSTMKEHKTSSQQYGSTKEVFDNIDCLKVQEKTKNERHSFIAQIRAEQKKRAEYMSALTTSIANSTMQLQSFSEKNSSVELSVCCTHQQQALASSRTIAQLPHLENVHLVSLRPESGLTNNVLATLKGRI